jgi:hypothetical protein
MFRIECYCQDKHLAAVLLALRGLILADPKVQPVANADDHLQAQTNGSIGELFRAHVRTGKVKVVNAAFAKDFLVRIGRSPRSSTYCLKEGQKLGYLRKKGKGSNMTYTVVS